MSYNRRNAMSLMASGAMLATAPVLAQSTFPSKPIRWLVGYPPGGGSDTIARIVGEGMAKQLGQPVVVDNKPGASANLAGALLAKSPADGYTIMNPDNGLLIFNPILYKQMGFAPSAQMKPVGKIGRLHLMLAVLPNHKARNFKELLQTLKGKTQVQYGASSIGSPLHLAMERLQREGNLNITHIPYKGAGPAVTDFLGGVFEVLCVDYSSGAEYVKAGKMRPLAVMSDKRLPALPDVPTVAESGFPGFEAYAWQGVVVPAGTPDAAVGKLNDALVKALRDSSVADRLQALGIEPTPSTPAQLGQQIKSEEAIWQPIVRSLGLTLD